MTLRRTARPTSPRAAKNATRGPLAVGMGIYSRALGKVGAVGVGSWIALAGRACGCVRRPDSPQVGPRGLDDCSRYKVLGVYPRRNAKSTLSFLERVVEEMPFPIQRIQTDRGLEFFAEDVQRRLMEWAIKFRPLPPRSPRLNGKVERTQRSDLEEFWATADPRAADIEDLLAEWQHFWNWDRLHMALGGNTPIDHICERLAKTPLADEVDARYDPKRERFRVADYGVDMTLLQLK